MGETHQYNHLHHHQAGAAPAAATSSRVGMRNPAGPGEIVEVQGGHIVRSTGRKDRHSKVCTAKGPRDRRVRLSAHTAIQFYDVQDRLGYDRPSKAVDWLIKKAKSAIDELAELPAWKPTTTTATTKARTAAQHKQQQKDETHNDDKQQEQQGSDGSSEREYNPQIDSFQITFQQHQHPLNTGSDFLAPSLDSDAIADTSKSFFPMGSGGGGGGGSNAAPSLSSFQNYPVPDLLSRTSSSSHNQDLRLSLQSFKEPIRGPPHEQNHHHQVLFSGPAAAQYLGYDGSSSSCGGWLEHHHQQHQNQVELGRFQRMVASWSAGGTGAGADSNGGSSGGGFIFNSIPLMQQPTESVLSPAQAAPQLVQPMLFGQNQLLIPQRGPLQSSNTPSVRAWIDPADPIPQIHPAMGFSPDGGFSGFRVPARIQGDEEEHDCIPSKPSSASSDSRH